MGAENWSWLASIYEEKGEGDHYTRTYCYGEWTIKIAHGHGFRPSHVDPAMVSMLEKHGFLGKEDAKEYKKQEYRSGHKSGQAFGSDITRYGITMDDIAAAIFSDLFDVMLEGTEDSAKIAHLQSGERSIFVGGTTIQYRFAVNHKSFNVGTYFLAKG